MSNNEAAERLRAFLDVWPLPGSDDEIHRLYAKGQEFTLRRSDIFAALAAERRATVERIRVGFRVSIEKAWYDDIKATRPAIEVLDDVLDAEAAR